MYISSMTNITVDVHQLSGTRRLQVTITERQYQLLREESARTSLSIAELVRRCIDAAMRPRRRFRLRGLELVLTISRELDAALAARRVHLKGQTGGSRRRVGETD
jgi:hypothetical protein